MDINEAKQRLAQLQQQYGQASRNVVDYNNQAGNFGQQLQDAINQRADTYKTERENVNNSREDYYNAMGTYLPQLLQQNPNNPMQAFADLERQRSRLGAQYQNNQDLLNQRQGTINDFIGKFNNSAKQIAQNQIDNFNSIKDQYAMAQNDYTRAFDEQKYQDALNQAKQDLAFRYATLNRQYPVQQQAQLPTPQSSSQDMLNTILATTPEGGIYTTQNGIKLRKKNGKFEIYNEPVTPPPTNGTGGFASFLSKVGNFLFDPLNENQNTNTKKNPGSGWSWKIF